MVMVLLAQAAVTPAGKPVAVPIPVATVVVCVILVKAVFWHKVGVLDAAPAVATVVGAAGWLCDAMATAVMVGGTDSAKWFGQPELQGYQVFAVNRHDATAWEI